MNKFFIDNLLRGSELGEAYSLCLQNGRIHGASGAKLGNRSGSSLEFMEHKDYMPGDDLRQLDWNVYARTERLTVKLFREEISPRLDLIIDGSASIAAGGDAKIATILKLLGFFNMAGNNANYHVKSWISKDHLQPIINYDAYVSEWAGIDFESCVTPSFALSEQKVPFQQHGARVFISDLFWQEDPKHFLSKLSLNASFCVIVQVITKDEKEPELIGNIELIDSETSESEQVFVDSNVIKSYKKAFSNHQENWIKACEELGVLFFSITAEEFANVADFSEFMNKEIIRHSS